MPGKKTNKKTKSRVAPVRKITKQPKFKTIGLAVILGLLVVLGYYIISSQATGGPIYTFGGPGDTPVPMDVVGNANDDLVVWRPSNGVWYVKDISGDAYRETSWGVSGDRPFSYYPSKTSKASLMIYRPSNQIWYVKDSATGASWSLKFGSPGDAPVPGDYDRDGVTDLAVWRKYSNTPNGTWIVRSSRDGKEYGTLLPTVTPTNLSVMDSDKLMVGNTVAFSSNPNNFGTFTSWRPATATWTLENLVGNYNQFGAVSSSKTIPNWGKSGDIPFAADFSRDGIDDLALFRPSNGFWYIKNGATVGTGEGTNTSFQYGTAEDIPFAFNWSTNPSVQGAQRYSSPAFFRPKSGRWYIAINLKAR